MRLLSGFFYVTYGFNGTAEAGFLVLIPTASEAGAVPQATANVNELPSAVSAIGPESKLSHFALT